MIAGEMSGNSRASGRSGTARVPDHETPSDAHLHQGAASSSSSFPGGAAQGGSSSPAEETKTLAETLWSALSHALEGVGHMQTLMQVRADRTRLSVRRWATIAIASLLALTALVPLILGGVYLFVVGVAQSLTHALGDRAWLGNLLGGVLILGLVAGCAWIAYARLARSEFAKRVSKYERIQHENEARLGAKAEVRP